MNDDERTASHRWPWSPKPEPAPGTEMMAAIAELRQRVKQLEDNEAEQDARLITANAQIAELRSLHQDTAQRLNNILEKLELGFKTVNSLLEGMRRLPFGDFN